MLIYLVRHGETNENRQRIIQGQLDCRLNDQGILQAERLAQRLSSVNFDAAFCSDLSRAKTTAEIIVKQHPGLKLESSEDLRERFMGSLQGQIWYPDINRPQDVESENSFVNRVLSWWDELLMQKFPSKETKGAVALVVGHGAWLGRLLRNLKEDRGYEVLPDANDANDGSDGRLWIVGNASIQIVQVTQEGEKASKGTILKWGDVQHLQGLDLVDYNPDLR